MPDGLKVPVNLKAYNGMSDPDDHLTVFMGTMDIHKLPSRYAMKQLGAIASTLHSIMKFPIHDGIAVVREETTELMCNQISRKRDCSSEEEQFQNEENDEETIVINEAYPKQKVE
ncbi:hypothetical protein Tco_1121369 [Tanacetum coccineum]|uniref:Reverse transcriptase domain-containing protein n=1 Tax=Tanacetum coccineum TaxID=301880 RepID=A0ABQ5IXQ8_9ASTR